MASSAARSAAVTRLRTSARSGVSFSLPISSAGFSPARMRPSMSRARRPASENSISPCQAITMRRLRPSIRACTIQTLRPDGWMRTPKPGCALSNRMVSLSCRLASRARRAVRSTLGMVAPSLILRPFRPGPHGCAPIPGRRRRQSTGRRDGCSAPWSRPAHGRAAWRWVTMPTPFIAATEAPRSVCKDPPRVVRTCTYCSCPALSVGGAQGSVRRNAYPRDRGRRCE